MNGEGLAPIEQAWTATELRKLPPAQRDAILEAAPHLAEEQYRSDPELTSFDAFGPDDLHGDSTAASEG